MQPEEQEEYQRKHPEYYSYASAAIPKYWQDGKMVDDKEYRVPSPAERLKRQSDWHSQRVLNR